MRGIREDQDRELNSCVSFLGLRDVNRGRLFVRVRLFMWSLCSIPLYPRELRIHGSGVRSRVCKASG